MNAKSYTKVSCLSGCVFVCVSTYFVSLSIAWRCRFVWVPAKTASCCAHFRQSPATRGAPSAFSASATCFSLCLRQTFSSSHSFWLTDRSFLKMEVTDELHRQRTGQEKRRVLLCTLTWGRWPEPPRFQSGPGRFVSVVPIEQKLFQIRAYLKYNQWIELNRTGWNKIMILLQVSIKTVCLSPSNIYISLLGLVFVIFIKVLVRGML